MDEQYLGKTGVRVSALALGTMSFGGEADERTAATMFSMCRDAGINVFDCANVYNGGCAEQILGRLIADCRDDVVISSKGYFPTGQGPNDRGASRYHLVRAVEASLSRLQTDRIDIYYIHHFDAESALEESLRTLDDLVKQGKILYPALSNFAAWQVEKALGIAALRGLAPPVAIQPMYSLLKRQAEVELLPMAAAEGLGVLPYSPLGGGLLSGKYGVEDRPEHGRLVDDPRYKNRYGRSDTFQIAEDFRALAAEFGYHPVSLAVAWVAAHPAVTAPLLGARSPEQLAPALAAVDLSLSPEEREQISGVSPSPPTATDRDEERIEYGR